MSIQNYEYTLSPGQTVFETVGQADYIFVRFADREFDIVIDNQTVTMEIGAEYTHAAGLFHRFTITNPDPLRPVVIRLAIGTSRYRSRIVQGELSVVPGIRAASGEFLPDTRWTLGAQVDITDPVAVTFIKKQQINSYSVSNALSGFAVMPKENAVVFADSATALRRYDLESGGIITLVSGSRSKTFFGQYLVECMSSTIDSDGNTWLCGRRTSDNAPAFVQVDSYLNPLGPVEVVPGFENVRSTNKTSARLQLGGRLFYFIIRASASNPSGGGQDGAVLLEKVGGQLLTRIEFPDSYYGYTSGHIENGQFVVNNGTTTPSLDVFDLNTFEQLAVDEGDYFVRGAVNTVTVDDRNREVWLGDSSTSFKRLALLEWTRTAQGTFETCAGGYAFDPEQTLTEAIITTLETDRGVSVSGQVLRAMLELWLGQFVADDYLDHIYRVEFDNADGRAPVTVSSGGTSFLGAGIEDSFTCVFPQQIRITLDKNLTTKE